MCGITGIFDTRGKRDIDRAVLTAHERIAAPPRPGRRRPAPRARRRPRPSAAVDHRPRHRPAAAVQRGRHRSCVVFNGEIYNYQELIPELQALGHVFHTRSDTEVIVHAWEAWGEACVERFRGMFAFALWDRNRETLFLARDRLGVKPLYYALLDDGTLLFGSELKSLLAHGGLRARHRPAGGRGVLRARLRGRAAHDLHARRSKLPPAHTLTHPARPARARAAANTGTCASRSTTRSAPKTPAHELRAPPARNRSGCA